MFEDDEIIVGINIKENSNKKTSNKTNKKNKSQNVKKNSKVNKKVLHKRKVLKFFMLIVIIIIASIILLSSSLFDLKNIIHIPPFFCEIWLNYLYFIFLKFYVF